MSSNLTATTPANMQWSDPNIPYAIIISLGAGLATGIGGSLVFVPDLMKRISQAMILAVSLALSAGVMIYVSFIEIFGKSYEAIAGTEGVSEGGAAAITTLCFFAGMGFCALLEVLVHWMSKKSGAEVPCPAHGAHGAGGDTTTASIASQQSSEGEQCETGTGGLSAPGVKVEIVTDKTDANHGDLIGNPEEAVNLSKMGLMTALAIAIHNFPEGLATFLATLGDVKLGASLGVAIAVHNIPEGLCVAMPIYYATGSRWKALTYSLLSGVTEPIGGILGFAVLQPVFTPLLFGIVFAMVGGMMVFIVCHELLPAAHSYMASGSNFVFGSAKAETTAWLICGMVIMAISLVLFVV